MLALHLLAVAAGLVLLARASDEFVAGAVGLSRTLGLSRVVIGAVVIGFGTSAPELLVSGIAAAGGDADVGIGNVLGSNAANLTLILGTAALITPLVVASRVIRREMPIALAAAGLFSLALWQGLTRLEAVGLLVALVAALLLIVRSSAGGDDTDVIDDEVADYLGEEHGSTATTGSVKEHVIRTGLGLLGTVAGAQLLVWGALGVADAANLSGGFVGLTLVALGTSLPELVTAIQAARKGEPDLIAGNVLGSNVFNSLGVGAVVGLLQPGVTAGDGLAVAGAFGLLAALGAWVMMGHQRTVNRYEGAALLIAYVVVVPFLA